MTTSVSSDELSSQAPQILASTPEWWVVNKPAGWLTIPGRESPQSQGVSAPVVSSWLEEQERTSPGFSKVWVVHRLDRETSGLLLFAKTAEAHQKANLWFSKHQVKKIYWVLASGKPLMPILKIQALIEGAPSLTQVEVQEHFLKKEPDFDVFLAKVRIVTGRRHQIRIHLSAQGYPVLGDERYGGPREAQGIRIGRVALHAGYLELPSFEKFEAPWPEDFQTWVENFRKKNGESK